MKCRHCGSELKLSLVDLGSAPPSNAYLTEQSMRSAEKWFPLRVLVCTNCWLVQTEDFAGRDELFNADYAYFSSFSQTWLDHAERYVEDMTERFGLDSNSYMVEVAANDGYLLQFAKDRNIPCTGVEPTASTAKAARVKGIPIVEDFFGVRLAKELVAQGKQADIITANNVLAHVPDINDFVAGFAVLLKPNGIATFEFPYLLKLIKENQFDTIYHEHFSYLSLMAVIRIFENNGLTIFDIEEHPTHGGSLRVFAQRSTTGKRLKSNNVAILLQKEIDVGMNSFIYYSEFQTNIDALKNEFLTFLLEAKKQGKSVAGYGAAAKGNTLLNYSGIRPDLISSIVDRNPAKQGKFMPGSRIPILGEKHLKADKPDYVVVFPWNLKEEISNQLNYIRQWDGKFITAVPRLEIV